MASVIYLVYESPHSSSVLPSIVESGGQPSDDGIRELAAPSRHSPMITHRLVVSYTTFSPLPYGGYFLLPSPTVTNSFHFQKWGTLCCPDFPLVPKRHQRQTVTVLSACKGTANLAKCKINRDLFSFPRCSLPSTFIRRPKLRFLFEKP